MTSTASQTSVHDLVRLGPLMARTSGSRGVRVALLDGPVAAGHPDLADAAILDTGTATCSVADSGACEHGTFVAGILSARRGSGAPAICPGCTLIVRPIFRELGGGRIPPATPDELSDALIESARAGARVLNLSAATAYPTTRDELSVSRALDYVAARGALIVAAAGNQATLGSSAITRHHGVIPVVAYDQLGRPTPESNLGGSVGRRGVGAPGESIVSLAGGGGLAVRSGTSFAAAFVTGAAALLWSLFPDADAGRLRAALLTVGRRRSVVPPLMDAELAQSVLSTHRRAALSRAAPGAGSGIFPTALGRSASLARMAEQELANDAVAGAEFGDETMGAAETEPETVVAQPVRNGESPPAVQSAQVSPPARVAPPAEATAPSYIYALGRIDWRFPSLGVEKEYAQATASPDTAGQTDNQVASDSLAKPELQYLVRQLCWVLVIGGLETYILAPRDPQDFSLLANSVREAANPDDLDAVIGVRGPIAPPEMCNGLALPIVVFDQIYSFDRQTLITSIPLPQDADPKIDEPQFRSAAADLFAKIIELADNAGATDEYRALNYLAVRYPRIYTEATIMHENNYAFTGVEVKRSPLTPARTVLDVVFSFTHRTTDVVDKRFVRVDATEEWPFLVKKISTYFGS